MSGLLYQVQRLTITNRWGYGNNKREYVYPLFILYPHAGWNVTVTRACSVPHTILLVTYLLPGSLEIIKAGGLGRPRLKKNRSEFWSIIASL